MMSCTILSNVRWPGQPRTLAFVLAPPAITAARDLIRYVARSTRTQQAKPPRVKLHSYTPPRVHISGGLFPTYM